MVVLCGMPVAPAIVPEQTSITIILKLISEISSTNWLTRCTESILTAEKKIAAKAISERFCSVSHDGLRSDYSNHEIIS